MCTVKPIQPDSPHTPALIVLAEVGLMGANAKLGDS